MITFRGSAKRYKKETAQLLWNIVCKQLAEASGRGLVEGLSDNTKRAIHHISSYRQKRRELNKLGHISVQNKAWYTAKNHTWKILKGQYIILTDYHPRRRKTNKLGHIAVQNIAWFSFGGVELDTPRGLFGHNDEREAQFCSFY
ncbi:hypothetical protein CEXT_599221 [Caerostris extrusa]|uniref:Transposase n=1 Tax=Caerostris extrusa TaxID=172846 RepID=A0AAV4S8K9_CAEEX|nr:hypothetical protein CEXT_599221 [Caerostris extrusa]